MAGVGQSAVDIELHEHVVTLEPAHSQDDGVSASISHVSVLQVHRVDLPISSNVTDQDWRRRRKRKGRRRSRRKRRRRRKRSRRRGQTVRIVDRNLCLKDKETSCSDVFSEPDWTDDGELVLLQFNKHWRKRTDTRPIRRVLISNKSVPQNRTNTSVCFQQHATGVT